MDSESVDRCIQLFLAALYPPFQATSPTVLCQVFSVVDSCYCGDGVRYLLHFLLPARQLLQSVQQHACLQYSPGLSLPQGWPLCVHNKLVVQLCPLEQHLLRPGDFYLLVSPPAPLPPGETCRSSVFSSPSRLLLCSMSSGLHHVEQQPLSEQTLRSLFSMAWLDSVNRERERRGVSPLQCCLLSAGGGVFRVPWEDLVYPQFSSRPRPPTHNTQSTVKDTSASEDKGTKPLPFTRMDQSAASSGNEDSEGEYVELTELTPPRFSPQKGSLMQSIRARIGIHATYTHTQQTQTTHIPNTPETPHSKITAAHTPYNTHTSATHSAAMTHIPHTHCSAVTHAHSSHTGLCSSFIEENLNQDSCGLLVTPTSSAALPGGEGASCSQLELHMMQKQSGCKESGRRRKMNTEEQEEVKQGKEEKEKKQGDGELMERQEVVELVYEGVEKEEEEFRSDQDVPDTEDEGEKEEDAEEAQLKEYMDVEEEVEVIIVQESQDRRKGEQVMKEKRGEEKEEVTLESHLSEDSNCENITLKTHSENTYCDSTIQSTYHVGSYCENVPHQLHPKSSYCENNEPQPQTDFNKQCTPSEDSYCERVNPPAPCEESWWSNASSSSNLVQTECELKDRRTDGDGGRGAVHLHHEGVSSPGPTPEQASCPQLDQSSQSSQSRSLSLSQSSFYKELLRSGALCLPGTRDRSGRVVLTVYTSNCVWSDADCDQTKLLHLLQYYNSTLRKEMRALGLTVLVDARRAAPVPALFSALCSLQVTTPGSIHSVLLLVSSSSIFSSSSVQGDRALLPQVEMLTSLKSLHKHVELQQLPAEFGGSLTFSQSSWLSFRSRVEHLSVQCGDVIDLLQKAIRVLQSTALPAAAEDARLLLSKYESVMCGILEDSRVVQLQREGGALLSLLHREESGISMTEESRAVVAAVASQYNEVDDLLHCLVTLSNSRTQQLNFIIDFSTLEQGITQIRSWLDQVGEIRLKALSEPDDTVDQLSLRQKDFKDFYTTAYEYFKRGKALLARLEHWDDMASADLHVYKVKVHSFWAQLQDFSQRVNATGHNIERALRLYRFLDQAYSWALEGMRQLACISMEDCMQPDQCQAVIGRLEEYQRLHPPIADARFHEVKAAAGELRGERGLRQWSFAWSKCQETKKVFDMKMEVALRMRDNRHSSDSSLSRNSTFSRTSLSGLWGGETSSSSSSSSCPPEDDTSFSSPHNSSSLLPLTHPSAPSCSSPPTPCLHHSTSSDPMDMCSPRPRLSHLDSSSSFAPLSSSSRGKQLRKTQSFDCPPTPEAWQYAPGPRTLSEPPRRGNTGVFIRGLEVSSTEASNHTLCPRTAARSPAMPGPPRTGGIPVADTQPGSKLRHIVEEMVTTEREYVRSLHYIIHHYFPEMERSDLPQNLRGQRSIVFGNLEKLLDFHSQFFLRELESCWKYPLRVSHCFLRHQEQFALYALYSKNKPKSDALLATHGNSFFRMKQVELGDKMDLSSYLLKPIQRMSKYALLLTDLSKEVGVAQEVELQALHAATNMVKFQLRHGNDLLAMDAIRDCDVNLKEQGQLIRQDEFTVCSGRRKCQRHIFLFEELVLLSKHKKLEGGLDVFLHKHSFKTADLGLTESSGDSGLRFEIWFRRRMSKNQTFVLQAPTTDVKHAWTNDITRILWTQAARNKEMRLKEMVSMGVGNKPFLDIQPSDAAISDRAVHYIMKSRRARTRASIAVSVFDHSNPFKQGAVTSDLVVCGLSSSSLLGPLNLHMYSQGPPTSADSSFISSCLEEDSHTTHTPLTHRSHTTLTPSEGLTSTNVCCVSATESSGSSSRRLSGSTGSDSGSVSLHLQEVLLEEAELHTHPAPSSNRQSFNSHYMSSESSVIISPVTVI